MGWGVLCTLGVNETSGVYRRIHMPRPLHDEIVKYIENGEYASVAEFCREAGRMLVEHHGLRERYVQAEEP